MLQIWKKSWAGVTGTSMMPWTWPLQTFLGEKSTIIQNCALNEMDLHYSLCYIVSEDSLMKTTAKNTIAYLAISHSKLVWLSCKLQRIITRYCRYCCIKTHSISFLILEKLEVKFQSYRFYPKKHVFRQILFVFMYYKSDKSGKKLWWLTSLESWLSKYDLNLTFATF